MTEKLLKFAQETERLDENELPDVNTVEPWNILVVDDDQAVHDITNLVLSDFCFDGRAIKLTFAYSAKEARELLSQPNDFSVLLLDVVMETDHAGLDLVSYIRNVINNQFIRIILRTGQPGQAPELSVIVDYDINDYRTKTELTSEKMRSCITAALRSYRDINTIRELAEAREKLQYQVSTRNIELEKANSLLQNEIEERFMVEELLATTNDKLESIINNSTALISLKDINGRYDLVNETFAKSLSVVDNDILGKTDHEVFSEETATMIRMNDEKVLAERAAIQCEEILPTKDGEHFYLCVKFPLFTGENEIYRICSICTDITERLEAQNKLLHLSQYDTLTNLPNRSLFIDRLTQAMSKNQESKNHIAIMFIDLDRFKVINDSLGHHIGDILLTQVAERLCSLVGSNNTVCRLGSDEFAILLTDMTSEADIVRVAEQVISSFSIPYITEKKDVVITVSVGISRCPIDSNDIQVLLKKADVAMYKAKRTGRNTYCFYLQTDDMKASEQLSLEVDMRNMLAKKQPQFFLCYQPKVNIDTGEYTSVEALLRWNHPEKGVIAPFHFIPLLEETGLIIEAGEWVLKSACLFAVRKANEGREMKVAVNLSPQQLQRKAFIPSVQAILAETGCKPQWLEFEVTESSLLDNLEETKLLLEEISAMGITLAIDDFGTGFSSLNYLKALPFNTLKIDRSFITDAPHLEQDKAIVTTIAQLASNLNMSVVAEGVETIEQFNLVKGIIGDSHQNQIQGYLFSKPLEEEALLNVEKDILSTWKQL